MIKSLILKGGGVLGIAEAGAIEALSTRGVLQSIQRVAGTSAGSILGLLVSLKYTPAEITAVMKALDFTKFEDGKNVLRLINQYGLYEGSFALSWIKSLFTIKGLPADMSFAQMKAGGFLDFYAITTNLKTRNYEVFSADLTPSVQVAEAVRASMSIPFFFKPFEFSNYNKGVLYVDGGTIWNYAISIFDKAGSDCEETLGLYLSDLKGQAYESVEYNHISEFVKAVLDCVMSAQDVSVFTSPQDMKRTVMIDDLGISATNFHLTDDQKDSLYLSGQNAVISYFVNNS